MTKLLHAPFTFKVDAFEKGELKAIGYLKNKKVLKVSVRTPEEGVKFKIWMDESGKAPQSGVNDVLFVYIAAVDNNGTTVPDSNQEISVAVTSDAKVMNVGTIKLEAGIATVLLKIGDKNERISIAASLNILKLPFYYSW